MKLLFALPGFHRFDRGAEVALLSVATELANFGHEVTVVGSGPQRDGAPYDYVRIAAIRREYFENFPTLPPLRSDTAWEDATFAVGILARLPLRNYAATVTCSFPFTHWALRKNGRSGPAHVFVTQNGDWPATATTAEYRWFGCDLLVCTNPDYFERNRERWPSVLVPNGISLEKFHPGPPARKRFGLPEDEPVILMVSALISSKRVLDGIKAIAALGHAHLIVAGDGPMRGEVRNLADRLLPGRFTQVSVPAADMPALYRSADAFMHLSLVESFGNVFLEAWASGLPIVAHDSEHLRWILGDVKFLCDTQDNAQLDKALRAAIKNGRDANFCSIERFSWSAIARDYEAAISATVTKRSS